MTYVFKNLVFEGGGVKGIGYVGALEVLEQKGILENIERVGGTSAGAINAVILGLDYSNADVKDIMSDLDFNNFMDDSWGVLRDSKRLIEEYGWYKGDFFRKWIGKLIKEKTGNSESTFADIHRLRKDRGYRDLYIVGTNLSTRYYEVFSYEHTPRMCVADAVRMSMSIPLFFAAKRSMRGDLYVDGGLLLNYPIKLFDRTKYVSDNLVSTDYYENINKDLPKDRGEISKYVFNKETLGFRLDSAKEIAVFRDHAEPEHEKIDDFFDYAWAMISTIMESQQNMHLHGDDWNRTIYIDTLGVNTTDFDLSDEKKEELIKSGRNGTSRFLDWYDKQ